jgi:hypothetical protein
MVWDCVWRHLGILLGVLGLSEPGKELIIVLPGAEDFTGPH